MCTCVAVSKLHVPTWGVSLTLQMRLVYNTLAYKRVTCPEQSDGVTCGLYAAAFALLVRMQVSLRSLLGCICAAKTGFEMLMMGYRWGCHS